MASFSPPDEQYASTPCWSRLDEVLRGRLAWLHHALGSDVLAPDEAAEQFSHILSDLLLEFEVITPPRDHSRHRPRRIETTLKNLVSMKNMYRRNLQSCDRNFITLVRAHN